METIHTLNFCMVCYKIGQKPYFDTDQDPSTFYMVVACNSGFELSKKFQAFLAEKG